ncbi:MAG: hypothetical protein ABI459_12430, partial [Deltaproteobacteria bacterium]
TPAALEQTFDMLQATANDIADWQGAPTLFTRYRGDGWQMALSDPKLALRACLQIMAAVQSLGQGHATRIAVGEGEGRFSPPDLADASGEAFVTSGQMLDKIEQNIRLFHAKGGEKSAVFRLSGYLAENWTQAQARSMALSLAPNRPTHSETAKLLKISRQAVEKSLAGAGFNAIDDALTSYEAAT